MPDTMSVELNARTTSLRVTKHTRVVVLAIMAVGIKIARRRVRAEVLERVLTELDPGVPVLFRPSSYSCFALGYEAGRLDPMHYYKHRAHARNPYRDRMYDSACVFHLYDVWRFGYYVACWVKLPAARRTPTGRPKKQNGGD